MQAESVGKRTYYDEQLKVISRKKATRAHI